MIEHEPGTEIVIGLVGPLGVDMDLFSSLVGQAVESVGFKPSLIRLSQLMGEVDNFHLVNGSESDYYDVKVHGLMESGNLLREHLGGNSLAMLSVLAIKEHRLSECGDKDKPVDRTAYILR